MNTLNDVWLHTYNLQIMIQQQLERLKSYMETNQIVKIQRSQAKLEIFTKLKRRIPSASVFLVMKIRKNIQLGCQINILIYRKQNEESKRTMFFIKDFNPFMYYYTLHRSRKHFCYYCLLIFRTTNVLKCILHCTKIKFSISDISSKCDQICSFPRIWSNLLKKSLMKSFSVQCSMTFQYVCCSEQLSTITQKMLCVVLMMF